MKPEELHIAGCVAYMLPDHAATIVRAIRTASLCEVPRADASGRAVLLIERESAAAVMDVIDAVRALEGVIAVHLAYQHAESESEMEKPHP
jgi:nitrate reductase NapAB chaperone NapD